MLIEFFFALNQTGSFSRKEKKKNSLCYCLFYILLFSHWTDNGVAGCFSPASKISCDDDFETPQPKKIVPTRSPPSDNSLVTTARKRSSLPGGNIRKSSNVMFSKLDCKKPSDWKVEVAVPHPPSSKVGHDDLRRRDLGISDSEENGNWKDSRPEANCIPFSKISNERMNRFSRLRCGSRIVPFHENNNFESAIMDGNATAEEIYENQKDIEDLSLIREQLIQIENQQSSMLNLLQVCNTEVVFSLSVSLLKVICI